MDKTFAELVDENKVLQKQRRTLIKKCSEIETKLKEILTEEKLSEFFKPYKVTVDHDNNYYSQSYRLAKLHVDDNKEISILSWRDLDGISDYNKAWELDNFNLFGELFNKYVFTYEAAMKSIEYAKKHTDAITALFEKFDANEIYNGYLECRKQINDLHDKIDGNVRKAQTAFIFEKYGAPHGEIVIGKTYYLYDTNRNYKIGLVEVLSKDASGIGYKCVDHEADDKKYPHVRKNRLEEDLRDFPKEELTWGSKDEE